MKAISNLEPNHPTVVPKASGYTPFEERLHSASHALGFFASIAAVAWLALTALRYGDGWRLLGGLVFGFGAMLMLGTSTLYHASRAPRTRAYLRAADHSAIYLLIAATYTPFTISVLRGPWGWGLFGTVWTMAIVGIVLRTTGWVRLRGFSTVLYLTMGWLVVAGFRQVAASLSTDELRWLIAGGLAYTAGVPFYIWKRREYTHAVWHLFVLAGVGCHYVAVLSLMRLPGH